MCGDGVRVVLCCFHIYCHSSRQLNDLVQMSLYVLLECCTCTHAIIRDCALYAIGAFDKNEKVRYI
jgi:hypothetical protein